MSSTKFSFVEGIVEQIAANPRKILAGHGIQGSMLQKIMKREDVMKEFGNVLTFLRTVKKGAPGLKKSPLFQIKAYKNFAELNTKARLDVEKFMAGLKGDDAANFSNSENIYCIVFDTATSMVPGPEGDDVIEQMTNPSERLRFDMAVRKEYKLPGVSYVIIMFAPSLVLPAEERRAARMAAVNGNKVKRAKKPAKVRMALEEKRKTIKELRKTMAKNKFALKGLKNKQFALEAQNAQYQLLRKKTGGAATLWDGIEAMNAKSVAAVAKKLNSNDAKLLMTAYRLKEQGDEESAKLIMSKIKNRRQLEALMNADVNLAGNAVIDARKKELAKTIRLVSKKLEQLQLDLAIAPIEKRKSIKSMISTYTKKLNGLKARMKFYDAKNHSAMGGKAQQLAQVRAAIEANIEEGNSISASLNAALAELDATPAQQQAIKQQIVQQVADGMPMQFAVQQAIQDAEFDTEDDVEYDTEDVLDGASLDDGKVEFEDLLDLL